MCITGYFYDVLSDCIQLHICALTSVNTIKIFKNECVLSVNLSLPLYSLISVTHIIYAWGLFSSSSCSHATGWYYPRLHIFWVFTACLCMYVCMAGLHQQGYGLCQDLSLHRTNTNTKKIQTNFHTLGGVWTYNPTVRGGEDRTHFNVLLPFMGLPFARFFRNVFSTQGKGLASM